MFVERGVRVIQRQVLVQHEQGARERLNNLLGELLRRLDRLLRLFPLRDIEETDGNAVQPLVSRPVVRERTAQEPFLVVAPELALDRLARLEHTARVGADLVAAEAVGEFLDSASAVARLDIEESRHPLRDVEHAAIPVQEDDGHVQRVQDRLGVPVEQSRLARLVSASVV